MRVQNWSVIVPAIVIGVFVGIFAVSALDKLYPVKVVENFEPHRSFYFKDGGWQAEIVGVKTKPCVPIVNSEAGYYRKQDGPWVEVKFEFVNDFNPGSSRPVGENKFGVWKWYAPQDAEELMFTINHMCKDLMVSTQAGPFKVQE